MVRGVLGMAGRRSPWGGDNGDGAGDKETGSGESHPEEQGTPDDVPSEPGEKRGPRNPWLPSDTPPPRRSAGIDDIFRNRDPRRTGGGGGGGSGGRGPGRGPGFPNFPTQADAGRWLPWAGGALAVILLGVSCVHIVGQKEEGLVTQFGRYSRTVGSGISLTLPWPIEHMQVTDVTSFTVDSIPDGDGEKLMLTSDKNLVDLSYLVRWNIKNLKNYTFQLVDPKETVREVAEASMRASIAQIGLDSLLTGAGRGNVEDDVRARMQRILDSYHAGVMIQGVEIKKADPPAKVVNAFQQVTVSQQEAERDRSDARAWAQQLLAKAQGDATSFDKVYQQYKLAPEVTKRRMWYETMEQVLRKNGAVIAEDSKGVVPYLPLPAPRTLSQPAAPQGDASASSGSGSNNAAPSSSGDPK